MAPLPQRKIMAELTLSLILLIASLAQCRGEGEGSLNEEHDEEIEEEHEAEPVYAILFPAFSLTVGVLVFILLSRFAKALPYTAVMFLLGTMMGIGATLLDVEDQLTESIRLWTSIDSEVLLLVFLPGLIFRDAMSQSVHLFRIALPQLLIFAFPMVLAGTVLTALIAAFIFPYGWSFNLAMTFGSILSATDPVAVAALLNEVGAPPRLKVHIAGESLLNDGSAIVFFSIFLERYLHELGVPGVGEDVDLPTGIALFAQKALGGVAIGIFFGLGLVYLLFCLDRRFNKEENIVEVSATIAVAYVGYYVAEPVFETSGVISTVVTGLIVKFLGRGMINSTALFDSFWEIVEHLLNTVLFSLGGVVWGAAVAVGEKSGSFVGRDWGFLILLYVLLHAIRFVLFMSVYPITSRVGLKTCMEETMFQIYGGLRGAVGIALAIALDNEVVGHTSEEEGSEFREQTSKVFGFVGGIAFMTLVVNGITAGPFLRKLGLADSSETRKNVVKAYRARFRAESIQDFVFLTTQPRFRNVNFALVSHHIHHLRDLTKLQLFEAADRYREITPAAEYHPPNFGRILPYLKDDTTAPQGLFSEAFGVNNNGDELSSMDHARKVAREMRRANRQRRRSQSTMHFLVGEEPLSAKELRTLFINILRAAYNRQVEEGELDDQQIIQIALEQSLDFAEDAVSKGEPLRDWDFAQLIDKPVTNLSNLFRKSGPARKFAPKGFRRKASISLRQTARRIKIERAIAFMAAHRWAQRFFFREFQQANSELSEGGKLVMQESRTEHQKAEAVLRKFDPKEVERTVSHKFCVILLTKSIHYVERLVHVGLLKESEAEEWVEELDEELEAVITCNAEKHPGEHLSDIDSDEEDADSLSPENERAAETNNANVEASAAMSTKNGTTEASPSMFG